MQRALSSGENSSILLNENDNFKKNSIRLLFSFFNQLERRKHLWIFPRFHYESLYSNFFIYVFVKLDNITEYTEQDS